MADKGKEVIYLGAGCFWCTEAVFKLLKGVSRIMPGYVEGVEVAEVEYNSEKLPLPDLVSVFLAMHDPTEIDRQGNDVGPQYRSVIFYTDPLQGAEAERVLQEKNELYLLRGKQIVTQVRPLTRFIAAEASQHNYCDINSKESYCQSVAVPKVEIIKKEFPNLLRQKSQS